MLLSVETLQRLLNSGPKMLAQHCPNAGHLLLMCCFVHFIQYKSLCCQTASLQLSHAPICGVRKTDVFCRKNVASARLTNSTDVISWAALPSWDDMSDMSDMSMQS